MMTDKTNYDENDLAITEWSVTPQSEWSIAGVETLYGTLYTLGSGYSAPDIIKICMSLMAELFMEDPEWMYRMMLESGTIRLHEDSTKVMLGILRTAAENAVDGEEVS